MLLIIIPALSFKSYPVYKTPKGEIVVDTLIPGKIVLTDTVFVYDPEIRKEETRIVYTERTLDTMLKGLKTSGKMTKTIDTLRIFDSNRNEESIQIFKIQYPVEFKSFFHNLELDQQDAILKYYGKKELIKKEK